MAKILTDEDIAAIFAEPKPITQKEKQKLLVPKKPKQGGHLQCKVNIQGEAKRTYCLISRRSDLIVNDFSIILMLVRSSEKLVLARCNGHHAKHVNRLEKTVIPADTCHIHRITER